jgi:hypothetical protein
VYNYVKKPYFIFFPDFLTISPALIKIDKPGNEGYTNVQRLTNNSRLTTGKHSRRR